MMITIILPMLPTKYNFFHSAFYCPEKNKRRLENLKTRLLTFSQFFSHVCKNNKNTRRDQWWLYCPRSSSSDLEITAGIRKASEENELFYVRKNWTFAATFSNESRSDQQDFVGEANHMRSDNKHYWLIDSGTSDHICNEREWCSGHEEFFEQLFIHIGNRQVNSVRSWIEI